MLPFLSELLKEFWGPFRLFSSYFVRIGVGGCLAMALTFWLLPRLWDKLPHDQGKQLVKGGEIAKGKPTGAGVIMVSIFTAVCFLVMPFNPRMLGLHCCPTHAC